MLAAHGSTQKSSARATCNQQYTAAESGIRLHIAQIRFMGVYVLQIKGTRNVQQSVDHTPSQHDTTNVLELLLECPRLLQPCIHRGCT
jgi:hypothetical protein